MKQIILVFFSFLLTIGCSNKEVVINYDIRFNNFKDSEINLVNKSNLYIIEDAFKRSNIISGDKIKVSNSNKLQDNKINVLLVNIVNEAELIKDISKGFDVIFGVKSNINNTVELEWLFTKEVSKYNGSISISVDENAYDKNADIPFIMHQSILDAIANTIVDIDERITSDSNDSTHE